MQLLKPFDCVIRTPARVRDMAVPFCGSLERGSEDGSTGRVVFHPVHEDVPLGPAVQTRNVAKTANSKNTGGTVAESDRKKYLEYCGNGEYGFTFQSETRWWVAQYAVAVAGYLDELFGKHRVWDLSSRLFCLLYTPGCAPAKYIRQVRCRKRRLRVVFEVELCV